MEQPRSSPQLAVLGGLAGKSHSLKAAKAIVVSKPYGYLLLCKLCLIIHSISASVVLTRCLFSGRYKSLIVDGSGSGDLKSVGDYVHLNPARAKLVVADAPLKSFAWSSWPAYLLARSKRPAWLRVDRLLGEWGIPKDISAGRQRL